MCILSLASAKRVAARRYWPRWRERVVSDSKVDHDSASRRTERALERFVRRVSRWVSLSRIRVVLVVGWVDIAAGPGASWEC